MLEAPKGIQLGDLQRGLKVLSDVPDTGGLAQPNAVLKVEEEASVVQVDGAHRGEAVVYYKVFSVDKTGVYSYICTPASNRGW